jgi:hypothetical protein
MTKVVGVTAEHQQNLMGSQVVRCRIVGSDLVTDLGDGTVITIGNVQGAQGATGPTGDVGDKGATGATGDKGATGETSSDWPRLLLVGSVDIPSVANQWVSVDIELPAVWGTTIPVVVAQASTSLPGTRVAYLGVSVAEGLITIKSYRTDATSHSVYFTAMTED